MCGSVSWCCCKLSVCCCYVIKHGMWVFWDAQSFFFFFFCPNAWPSFRQRRSEPEPTKQSALAWLTTPASICDITIVMWLLHLRCCMPPSHFPSGLLHKCASWARTGGEYFSIQLVNLSSTPRSSLAQSAVYHVILTLSVSDVLRGSHRTHDICQLNTRTRTRVSTVRGGNCRNWNAAVHNQHMHFLLFFCTANVTASSVTETTQVPVDYFLLTPSSSLSYSLTLVWICWIHGTGSCGSLQRGGHHLR